MSESLRNDGRIWVPKKIEDAQAIREGRLKPTEIAEEDRDYYLERRYPAFGNLVPRDIASRAAKERCDAGYGVGATGFAVYLDFKSAIERLGRDKVEARYGNLFQMYEKIVDVNPYENPMMIYPAVHYTMGGLWVDYELQTTIPGLFATGEANFSDHGANRLGASALMQGLADGYFVLPYTMQNYLSDQIYESKISTETEEFAVAEKSVKEKLEKIMSINGEKTVDTLQRELGHIMWEYVGMGRNAQNLQKAIPMLENLKKEFWSNVRLTGDLNSLNPELEKAVRLADHIELAQIMAKDALQREESCGGHYREEFVTEEGEAKRNDQDFMFVGVWEYKGKDQEPVMHKEDLKYEFINVQQRNYK